MMSNSWHKIKYWWERVPVRPNFFGLCIVIYICYSLIAKTDKNAEGDVVSSYSPLLLLMAKVALIIAFSLFILSFISSLFCFIYFKIKKDKTNDIFQLNSSKAADTNGFLNIQPMLKNALKPLLGFVAGRLIFQNLKLSKPFILSKSVFQKNSLKLKQLEGRNEMRFPDIKEYEIKGVLLFFEDMFHLFRGTFFIPQNDSLYNPPTLHLKNFENQDPLAAKEQDIRIEQLKNIAGEYLNYKHFEYGDDVRRIVWKIYGKNREMVVRQIENRNPYASELLLYASFHVKNYTWLKNEAIANTLLNFYKNEIWSLYHALKSKGLAQIQFVPEQQLNKQFELKEEEVAFNLASAEWQTGLELTSYFDTEKGSLFCIHSLTKPETLLTFLENGGDNKQLFFAELSKAIPKDNRSIIEKIFLKPKNNKNLSLGNIISLTKMKSQLVKNELLIKKILDKFSIQTN
jgi:hypothetical protein